MRGPLSPSGVLYLVLGLSVIWLVGAHLVHWEHQHDTPLLDYVGYLIVDEGRLPYRDIFETSMPLTMLIHAGIYAAGLSTDPAFFLTALTVLFVLAGLGAWDLRDVLGRNALLFALIYTAFTLILGALSLMQRDWLALIFIVPAFILCLPQDAPRSGARALIAGMLFGCVALIKPQLALPAPLFILAPYWPSLLNRDVLRDVVLSLAGFALPLIVTFLVMWQLGIWPDFWFILTEYVPLYVGQTGEHAFVTLHEKLATFVQPPVAGGFWPLALGLLLVAILQIRAPRRPINRQTAYVTVLAFAYFLVPYLSGQMWDYHFLPFAYFTVMAVVIIWFSDRTFGTTRETAMRLRSAVVILALLQLWTIDPRFRLEQARTSKGGNVAAFEHAITKWLPAGQPMQPIDWTAGVVHAMLRQHVPLATSFLYDFHFYHSVSDPVNAKLRARFLSELAQTKPPLILLAKTRPHVSGLDTEDRFEGLESFLKANYAIVEETPLYIAYRSHQSLD